MKRVPSFTSTGTMRCLDGSRLVGGNEVVSDAGSGTTKFTAKWFLAFALGALGAFYVYHPDASIRRRVRDSVFAPDGVDARQDGIDALLFSGALILAVAFLDVVVARLFGPARYFALHVIVNAANVYFAWGDFVATFTTADPFGMNTCYGDAGVRCANKFAIALTIALHAWHMLAYTLSPIDLVHHIPTQIVCCSAVFIPWGPAMNVNTMCFMGLPGGIDYFLLVLVKLKIIGAGVEKDLNQTLNVWLRCPLGVIIAFIMVFGAVTQPNGAFWPGRTHRALQAAMGLQLFWNAQFFMYRTVDARTRYVTKKKQSADAAKLSHPPQAAPPQREEPYPVAAASADDAAVEPVPQKAAHAAAAGEHNHKVKAL